MTKKYFTVMSAMQVEAEDSTDAEKIFRMHLASGQGDVTTREAKLCWVRADIIKNRYAVPIGDGDFYGSKDPLPYRWVGDDDVFEVFYNYEWVEAYSIDFDFTNELVKEN